MPGFWQQAAELGPPEPLGTPLLPAAKCILTPRNPTWSAGDLEALHVTQRQQLVRSASATSVCHRSLQQRALIRGALAPCWAAAPGSHTVARVFCDGPQPQDLTGDWV